MSLSPGVSKFVRLRDTPPEIAPGRDVVGNKTGDALEFLRRAANQGGLEVVSTVPTDNIGAVLHLKHAAATSSGGVSDIRLTPGFVAPDFYGYSDGTAYPAVGMLSGHTVPLAWIGSDKGTRNNNDVLTSWEADYIASPSRSWLHQFEHGWISGRGFELDSAEVFEGGVWLKAIILANSSFNNANAVTFNLRDANNYVYFRAEHTVFLPGGILWWNENKYVLLGYNSLVYKGLHDPTKAYINGEMVVTTSGRAYICIAPAPANTLITDTTKWVTLTRTSIVDVTGQGGHPQIVEANKDQLHADFSIPRLWLPHHVPKADTPAKGTSALWPIAGRYSGTHDYFPPSTPVGNIGYSRAQRVWQRKDSASARATLSLVDATANKNDFPGAFVWLGERVDANAAAAHVPGNPENLADATTYLFYNETSRVVETLGGYVQSISPGELYTSSRLLTYADWQELKSVQETVGNPVIDKDTQHELNVDPSVPRVWVTKRIPFGSTPATGSSTPFPIDDKYLGSRDFDPPHVIPGPVNNVFGAPVNSLQVSNAVRNLYGTQNAAWLAKYNNNRFFHISVISSAGTEYQRRNSAGDAWEVVPAAYLLTIGQIYYNQFLHYWAIFSDFLVTTGQWTHTSYIAALRSYGGTTYWLGERSSANDAAAHVVFPKDDAGRYIFYNTSTYSLELLGNASIVAAVDAGVKYIPIPLVTFQDRVPEILVDTLANGPDVDVSIGSSTWVRNTAAVSQSGGQSVYKNERNQIAFLRQLTELDDQALLCVELEWEEVDALDTATTVNATKTAHKRFMGTISAGGFRRLGERIYGVAVGHNENTLSHSAEWFIRQPDADGGTFAARDDIRLSYGRFRAAYLNTALGDDSAAARALAPDGIALHWGSSSTTPNSTYIQKLRARVELHR